MTFGVNLRKVHKERTWSIALVALLSVGMTAWIVIPSISANLQEGLTSYGNNISTYILAHYNGISASGIEEYRLPSTVTEELHALAHIEAVYPIVENTTWFWKTIGDPSSNRSITGIGGFDSAVFGSDNGFPFSLISIIEGRLPQLNEPSFLVIGRATHSFSLNKTETVLFKMYKDRVFSGDDYYINSNDTYLRFEAAPVGYMPLNPMFMGVPVLWDASFLQQRLGKELFTATYGGEGANMFLVKVEDIAYVSQVAESMESIFGNYPGYTVVSDEAGAKAVMSFQSGTQVLFEIVSVFSLVFSVSLVFLFTYVFSARRRWEVGLLVTQGWAWSRVTKLYLSYYLTLGIVAVLVSVVASMLAASQISYTFKVYGNEIAIPVSVTPFQIESAIVVTLAVSVVATYFAIWRMKKMGLDNLLREF